MSQQDHSIPAHLVKRFPIHFPPHHSGTAQYLGTIPRGDNTSASTFHQTIPQRRLTIDE
jgi:hypothetical protein